MEKKYKYLAYISYSRQDEKWAKFIQSKLEHYEIPKSISAFSERTNLRPIFCGINDLTAGVLSNEIFSVLNFSKYLIVICSPSSARSNWVDSEIQQFITLGRKDFIIPVIVEGKPHSYSEEECYPPALRQLSGGEEILGLNFQEYSKKVGITRIAARILGVKFDQLWKNQQRANLFGIFSQAYKRLIESLLPTNQDYIENYIPKQDQTQIFISYRRDDGQGAARSVQQALIHKYDGKAVFFDFTSIDDGKFNLQIIDAIYSCTDFILVLSPKAMKRCTKRSDWVALEIRTAIKYNKHIVPINIDNKFLGFPKRFPKDLDKLKYEQQLEFQMGTYFSASVEKLTKRLNSIPSVQKETTHRQASLDYEQRIMSSIEGLINKAIANVDKKEFMYKVRTNKKCVLFIDGDERCVIESGSLLKIPLKRGQYLISIREEGADRPSYERNLDIQHDIFDDLCF